MNQDDCGGLFIINTWSRLQPRTWLLSYPSSIKKKNYTEAARFHRMPKLTTQISLQEKTHPVWYLNLGKLIYGVISWADFKQPFPLQAAPVLICNWTCQALPISIIHGQTTSFSLSGDLNPGILVYQAESRSDMRLCIGLSFCKETQFAIRCSVKCLWKNLADSVPSTPLFSLFPASYLW